MRAVPSDSAGDLELAPNTDWLRVETRWVRGFGSRWSRLLQSRSLELENLTRLCDRENEDFKNAFASLLEQQKLSKSKTLTD